MMHNQIQRVFLHIDGLDAIRSFKYLYNVFKRNVHLEILFTKRLETVLALL